MVPSMPITSIEIFLDILRLRVSSHLLHNIHIQNGHLHKILSVYNFGSAYRTLSKKEVLSQPVKEDVVKKRRGIILINKFALFSNSSATAIRSSAARTSVRVHPKRTAVSSPKSSCVPARVWLGCRPAPTREPPRPDSTLGPPGKSCSESRVSTLIPADHRHH